MYNVQEVFKRVSSKMRAEFEEACAAVSHPTIKGDNSEKIVHNFLKKYLPKSLDITSGIIIDSDGNSSKQIDIIITDAHATPILFEGDESRVVPVEPVYAVIEVKSNLTSSMIPAIIENMLSVKRLNKKAFYKAGSDVEHSFCYYDRQYEISPIMYFFFAFKAENSLGFLDNFSTEFATRNLDIPMRIDCGCILDEMVYANMVFANRKRINALPSKDSILSPIITDDSLLLFYSLISNYLNQSSTPSFRFNDYIKNIQFS